MYLLDTNVWLELLLDREHALVAPLTTKLADEAEPLRVRLPAAGKLRKESDLLIDQLRAIDNQRLIEGPLMRLTAAQLQEVDQAITEFLDLA